MKKIALFVCIAAMSCLLISPVWAENSDTDDLQALKTQLMELNKLVQSQQERIQEQEQKLQQQERKLLQQEYKILDLEEISEETVPYAETVDGMHVEEVVERVKAELTPAGDGITIGGGKIRITPYGFIRLDMAYDDSQAVVASGNVVAFAKSEDAAPGFPGSLSARDNDDAFYTTATATRFGMNFDGPEFADGKVRGKLEIDFDEIADNGGDVTAHRIRLRHAYAELVYPTWSLLAGQTWDVIAPRIPYQLDCIVLWGCGNVGYRRPQLRLTKWWDTDGSKITGQLSLNHTDRQYDKDDFDTDGTLDGADAGWPMVQGRLGLDTEILEGRKLGLGISGAVAGLQADNSAGNKTDLDVWLVALDHNIY